MFSSPPLISSVSSQPSLSLGIPFIGYVLLFSLSGLICFGTLHQARRIEATDVRRGLAGLLALSGGWAASHVGYLAAPTPQLQYVFFVVGLVMGLAAVGAWLYFCSAYTGRTLHRNRTLRWTGIGVYSLIVLLKITNPVHHYYFTTEAVTTPFSHLLIHYQPLHWVVMGSAYALAFIGFFMLFELFSRVSYDTTPLYLIVAITGVPVLFDVLGAMTPYLLDLTYSPLGVAVFAIGVFYFYSDRFQTIRLTGPTDNPIIVLDDDDYIHDTNRAARDLFPVLSENANKPLAEVLPEIADALDASNPTVEQKRDGNTRYYSVTENPFTADQTRL